MADDRRGDARRAVALVSGGLDSVVSLAAADRELEVRLVLFCNYGQRALAGERAAAMDVAGYYGLPFREVDVTWLRDLAPEGMRGRSGGAAGGRAAEDGEDLESLNAVWIPNRNGLFINVAAAFAESYRCGVVVTGFNVEEAAEFPDNGPEFVRAINDGLSYSTRSGVRVVSFTQGLTKREILEKGAELSVPLGGIWSCYASGERMCGVCGSCRRLKGALESIAKDRRPIIDFAG
jgi:7-cyano-7-deazaguanine synthase